MTDAEQQLWWALHELELRNRFRRQHPIGARVVDFACPAAKLAIEVDGGQHAINEAEDEARTQELARYGYQVIRFWNGDVMENIEGVLLAIKQALEVSLSAPGGGEGRGEVEEPPRADARPEGGTHTHLTLPVAVATGRLPLRPKGLGGHGADHV